VTLLGHVRGARADFIFGPKLGWSIVLRDSAYAGRTYPFVNGLQMAAKMGVFLPRANRLAVGLVLDLAYIRAVRRQSYLCFSGEPDCSDTQNTALGSVTLALLL
jgi:hypothetical protein